MMQILLRVDHNAWNSRMPSQGGKMPMVVMREGQQHLWGCKLITQELDMFQEGADHQIKIIQVEEMDRVQVQSKTITLKA